MKGVLFFLFSMISAKAFTQAFVTDTLLQDVARYQSQTTQEKLFVHTDKSFYVAGETMWYKVYDVDASTHKPLAISKVSYLEVMDKENKPVLQAKINMDNGAGNGSFQLPFSMPSGNYVVRAYTNWMKNFSSDFFFEKQVTIVNTLKNELEEKSGKDTMVYYIQFFPEGGNLVNGLESMVAFKGVNQYGQSIDFSGFLVNEKNDTLLRFQPFKFGMGKFSFTPQNSEQYRAVIRVNNQTVSQVLPHVYGQGYVMKLTSSGSDHLTASVTTNQQSAASNIYLFVQAGKKKEVVEMKTIINGKAEFTINNNQLQEGISRLTLFNNDRQPLCERLFCKQPKQQLQIAIKPDATLQNTRSKIQLQINTSDSSQPVSAGLSLSVFRVDSFQAVTPDNIFNYLWLTSEIKGNIESPDYYFSDSSAEEKEALDNLMLTQGWRRFQWNEVMQNKVPSFHFLPEYEGQLITGKIINETTGLPAAGVSAYLSIPGEKFAFATTSSDENGNLAWAVNHFYGAGQAIAQTSDTTANHYRITLSDPFYSTPFHTSLSPFHLSEKWKNSLLDNSINAQAQNVYLSDETQHFLVSETDTTAFYGKPDKRYLLDDYTRFPTMEEVMREYVTEVRVSKAEDKYRYTVDNLPYRSFFKDEPLLLVDGVPVWNVNKIIAFNPLLVRQLDVVTHKYYLGAQTYNGIVSYITYKGDTGGLELNPNAVQVEYEGLQLEREFYTPIYETPQQISSRIPDFRNVLYWSPNVVTDSNGKATVTFYTSDLTGNYAIELQGNTAMGLAGSKVISIVVKK